MRERVGASEQSSRLAGEPRHNEFGCSNDYEYRDNRSTFVIYNTPWFFMR